MSAPSCFTHRKMTIPLFTVSKYKHDLVYSVGKKKKKKSSQTGCDQLLSVLIGLLLVLAPWEWGAGFAAGDVHSLKLAGSFRNAGTSAPGPGSPEF